MATNTSTDPPTLANPVGSGIDGVNAAMLALMTIVVGMRLWGRYRYTAPGKGARASTREPRFWIMVSDVTILVSFISAAALSAVQFNAVKWGQGLHVKQLSTTQRLQVAEMFYIYQVLYKWVAGIGKMATVFLLLAISTPQMTAFNRFCKLFALYIGLYCVACSLAAVFQCSTNFASNWDKAADQSRCFYLPPFWYAHAVINITATMVTVGLPWWLFARITYKRKYIISSSMTVLAVGEVVLGAVRLWSLTKAAANSSDITYSSSTGQVVSQLEVDFAILSACIPTVLKLTEELFRLFCVKVLGMTSLASYGSGSGSHSHSHSRSLPLSKPADVRLSELRSIDRWPKPRGPYASFDKDSDSMESQSAIIPNKGASIRVRTEVEVEVSDNSDGVEYGKRERENHTTFIGA